MSPAGHAQQRSAAINVEWEDGEEVFGPQGTGGAHRGELFQSGINFACLSLCVVPVWRVSRLLLSAFAYTVRPTPVYFLHTGLSDRVRTLFYSSKRI